MQIEGDQCRRCGSLQTEVIDRRYRKKVDRVIRRRKCLECGYKWKSTQKIGRGYPEQDNN